VTWKFLVTGGTGFLGKRLVARLVGEGCEVRMLTRKDAAETSRTFSFAALFIALAAARLILNFPFSHFKLFGLESKLIILSNFLFPFQNFFRKRPQNNSNSFPSLVIARNYKINILGGF